MNLRKAAQQALNALELGCTDHEGNKVDLVGPAITALRAALEPVTACHELSKEGDKLSLPFDHFADAWKMVATISSTETVKPVAYSYTDAKGRTVLVSTNTAPYEDAKPLYSAPPKREPLTDAEIRLIDSGTNFHEASDWSLRFARAIERAHGIGGEE